MSKPVSHLSVPPMDLTITEAGNGKLKVELNVPRSSGSLDNIPFLEVTRNEQATLLNGARQTMISKLSQSGFQISDVQYEAKAGAKVGGTGGVAADVEKVGKVSFEISQGGDGSVGVKTSIRNNPDVAGAISAAETGFDTRRQDIYEQRAREWYGNGGAMVKSDGKDYSVTQDAAKNYVNGRHPINPFKRISMGDDGALGGIEAFSGDPLKERQFAQVLNSLQDKDVPNKRDAAALAVQAISSTPGYDPAGEVNVVAGNKGGLVAFQGQDASGVRASVPEAKPGDFERVSEQLAQVQTLQLAQQTDQPERTKTQSV